MLCSACSVFPSALATLLLSPRDARLLDRCLAGESVGAFLAKLVASDVVPSGFPPGAMHIRYQRKGLGLVRRNFRVDKAVWFRLGQIARTQGASRCLVFVSLLRAYAMKAKEFQHITAAGRWLLTEIFHVGLYKRITRLGARENEGSDTG